MAWATTGWPCWPPGWIGGPLFDQLIYQPEACGEGQGIGADGTVRSDATAPALVSGQTYFLVALLDIYKPAIRCLFTAGG
ncbi:hypothetical protein L6R53_12090 [Myxococcota bacterium]|nr:hypothetical protein [Myxococcota bacterium]